MFDRNINIDSREAFDLDMDMEIPGGHEFEDECDPCEQEELDSRDREWIGIYDREDYYGQIEEPERYDCDLWNER